MIPRSSVLPSDALQVNISAFFSPSVVNFAMSPCASSATTFPADASITRVAGGTSCVWYMSIAYLLSDEMPHPPAPPPAPRPPPPHRQGSSTSNVESHRVGPRVAHMMRPGQDRSLPPDQSGRAR